ncbi:YtxH domain-containing protein [Candidatus Saganbacteria bacterium]|nr:YtxH domain-containing protein [Candidatus Saganbacteria bacterium]
MSEEKSSYFEGLMLGGILGAVAGVLLAPLAGEEMRQNLKAKLEELDLEGIGNKFSRAFEEGRKEMEKTMKEQEVE